MISHGLCTAQHHARGGGVSEAVGGGSGGDELTAVVVRHVSCVEDILNTPYCHRGRHQEIVKNWRTGVYRHKGTRIVPGVICRSYACTRATITVPVTIPR